MNGGDVRFTRHALERFAERAGVAGSLDELRAELEQLAWHGSVVSQQPPWSHLEPAPAFLVVAQWLCTPLRPGERDRVWDATTVITRNDMSWWDAVRAGWLTGPPSCVHIWPATPAMQREITAKRVALAAAAARQAAVMDEARRQAAEQEARRQADEADAQRSAAAAGARARDEANRRNRTALRPYGWAATALTAFGMSLAIAPVAPIESDGEASSELLTAIGYGFWCGVFVAGLVILFEIGLRKLWSLAACALTLTTAIGFGVAVKTTGSEDHIGVMLLCAAAGLTGALGVRTGTTGMARAGVVIGVASLVIASLVAAITAG
jgi:hypothetical protein